MDTTHESGDDDQDAVQQIARLLIEQAEVTLTTTDP